MNDREALRAPSSNTAAWHQAAANQNGMPPGGGGRTATSTPPRDPSLTEKFNAAANPLLWEVVARPVSKLQIEVLKKKKSQPRAAYDRTPLGSVRKAYNPKADRVLMETITALTARLAARKGLKERFALAANKGELKKQFNRSSRGMGM